jgi:hypothetical protein
MELVIRVLVEHGDLIGSKLDQIIRNQERMETRLMALEEQLTQLQTAVADVKQASDDEAVRVDMIIAALEQGAGDNPVVAQAITDLQGTAAALRAFHAEQPVAG